LVIGYAPVFVVGSVVIKQLFWRSPYLLHFLLTNRLYTKKHPFSIISWKRAPLALIDVTEGQAGTQATGGRHCRPITLYDTQTQLRVYVIIYTRFIHHEGRTVKTCKNWRTDKQITQTAKNY